MQEKLKVKEKEYIITERRRTSSESLSRKERYEKLLNENELEELLKHP